MTNIFNLQTKTKNQQKGIIRHKKHNQIHMSLGIDQQFQELVLLGRGGEKRQRERGRERGREKERKRRGKKETSTALDSSGKWEAF